MSFTAPPSQAQAKGGRWMRRLVRLSLGLLALGLLVIVGRLYLGAREPPSAIVVLGGGIQRELHAADIARSRPQLSVIVSSGSPRPCLYGYFTEQAQVAWDRVTADYWATDTLTNFTATLPLLRRGGHRHVLLVTSESHLPRARLLASIVWGSHGIAFDPATVRGRTNEESNLRTLADGARALLWVIVGDAALGRSCNPPEVVRAQLELRETACEPGVRAPGQD
jgi:uncharacterized SAM-binding protein YcdF (DUF218 family)